MTRGKPFSIKARLLISHWILTVIMASIVMVISMAWFRNEQENRLNDFLLAEAQRIKSGIEAFYEGDMKNSSMKQDDLRDYLAGLMSARLNRAVAYKTTLAVFDASGLLLAKSNDAIDVMKLTSFYDGFDKNRITINTGAKKPFRMVSSVLVYNREVIGYFNLGMLNEPLIDALAVFRNTLILFLGCIVLFVGGLGSLLIYLIFNSIKSITASADKISESRLDLRLPVPPGKDEIHFLAITINRLLSRLETDFNFQEDLVSQLSHQLRTPLTIMRGRNENALALCADNELQKENLEDNLADIDAITSLLHTLLDLARLDSRVDRVTLLPLNPVDVLNSVVIELSPLWEDKNLSVKWIIPSVSNNGETESAFSINADAHYLKQAFVNILGNAYKYSPAGGKITIAVNKKRLEDRYFCRLVIANEGPPIPEESLDLIFKKFYRVKAQDSIVSENSTGSVEPGFGLGLSICKTLIELQSGTIKAFNPLDGGAAFEILFPVS
jgi:signal transduction histidine kinase